VAPDPLFAAAGRARAVTQGPTPCSGVNSGLVSTISVLVRIQLIKSSGAAGGDDDGFNPIGGRISPSPLYPSRT
jgi:hypothetical protein